MGNFIDLSVTIFVLLSLTIIIYCKVKSKTIGELIMDIREGFSDTTEEVNLLEQRY